MELELVTEPAAATVEPVGPVKPAPPQAAKPSYAPILLALGVTMLFWGIATSPIMSLGGLVIFLWAASMWIRQIAQAQRKEHVDDN